MKLSKFLSQNSGFTLVQATLAAMALGAASLAIMQNSKNASKINARNSATNEVRQITEHISSIMSDRRNCSETLIQNGRTTSFTGDLVSIQDLNLQRSVPANPSTGQPAIDRFDALYPMTMPDAPPNWDPITNLPMGILWRGKDVAITRMNIVRPSGISTGNQYELVISYAYNPRQKIGSGRTRRFPITILTNPAPGGSPTCYSDTIGMRNTALRTACLAIGGDYISETLKCENPTFNDANSQFCNPFPGHPECNTFQIKVEEIVKKNLFPLEKEVKRLVDKSNQLMNDMCIHGYKGTVTSRTPATGEIERLNCLFWERGEFGCTYADYDYRIYCDWPADCNWYCDLRDGSDHCTDSRTLNMGGPPGCGRSITAQDCWLDEIICYDIEEKYGYKVKRRSCTIYSDGRAPVCSDVEYNIVGCNQGITGWSYCSSGWSF